MLLFLLWCGKFFPRPDRLRFPFSCKLLPINNLTEILSFFRRAAACAMSSLLLTKTFQRSRFGAGLPLDWSLRDLRQRQKH